MMTLFLYMIGCMTSKALYETSLANKQLPGFVDGRVGFITNVINPCWFFIGVEVVTIAGAKIGNVSSSKRGRELICALM